MGDHYYPLTPYFCPPQPPVLFFLMYNDYVHCRKNREKKQNSEKFSDTILEYMFFRSNNSLP